MFDSIFEVFLGIIGLSAVVLVHEGGHYLTARLSAIRVEVFSIGFGRRLFGFKRGNTDYRLSMIPLGGYCRFYGEKSFRKALDEKLKEIPKAEGEFYSSSPLSRILVSVSGPLANLIFAILIFTTISWAGYNEEYVEPRIILLSEWSDDGSIWPADHSGLQSEDLIVLINQKPIKAFHELRPLLAFKPDEQIELTVERKGRTIPIDIVPTLDEETGFAMIGVLAWVDPIIASTSASNSSIGLQEGDRIIRANDIEIPHSVALYKVLEDTEAVHLTVLRKGREVTFNSLSAKDLSAELSFQLSSSRSESVNFFQATVSGFRETFLNLSSTLRAIRMLFLGTKPQNVVSGPIRLISDTGAIVAEGFRGGFGPGMLWTFELLAIISISLAFLNLLPIPVLDGGQIILFIFELLQHKPIGPKTIYRYQVIGTIIVLFIAMAAIVNDIIQLNNR
ncbi:Intramembrane protease RasP/YluC, implicated in cell division based on FtsL cleavage [Olavius algarvensis spirochete endosymbiont]|uniref:RIP metalloprotease RseP n=1 Tax=Olavius algarvensis spirochete endosymbiont TaxID=260710 RepID=UPI00052E0867|nr:RIP metalloprotease RseP [Olavius algarvensis spirochete endosymbiont]KGM42663.1 hypothetical protein JY97_12325 [Alkalispirochaeta odontotermitis]VDB00381.1 Intramembrane protease RasP/YluC, implicated in cell division based on FtsL cleavage [Olavius algarvensis spirochete endosymbiont]